MADIKTTISLEDRVSKTLSSIASRMLAVQKQAQNLANAETALELEMRKQGQASDIQVTKWHNIRAQMEAANASVQKMATSYGHLTAVMESFNAKQRSAVALESPTAMRERHWEEETKRLSEETRKRKQLEREAAEYYVRLEQDKQAKVRAIRDAAFEHYMDRVEAMKKEEHVFGVDANMRFYSVDAGVQKAIAKQEKDDAWEASNNLYKQNNPMWRAVLTGFTKGASLGLQQVQSGIQQVSAAWRMFTSAVQMSVNVVKDMVSHWTLIPNLIRQAASAMSQVVGVFKEYSGEYDTYISSVARMGIVATEFGVSQLAVQERLFDQSNDVRVSYQETAREMSRLGILAGDAFANYDELEKYSTLLQKTFTLSGTDSMESLSAFRQISQSLASGVFQGDEYRSVRENAPLVIQYLVDYINSNEEVLKAVTGKVEKVTKGSLKALASEGKLTSDVLIKSMMYAEDAIEKDWSRMPVTFQQLFDKLKTTVYNAMTPVFDGLQERINNLYNSDLWTKLSSGIELVISKVRDLTLWFKELFTNSVVQEAIANTYEKLKNFIIPAIEKVLEVAEEVITWIAMNLDGLIEQILQIYQVDLDFVSSFTDGGKKIAEVIEQGILLAIKVAQKIEEIRVAFLKFMTETLPLMLTLAGLIGFIVSLLTGNWGAAVVWGAIAIGANEAKYAIIDLIEETERLFATFETVPTTVSAAFDAIEESSLEWVTNLTNAGVVAQGIFANIMNMKYTGPKFSSPEAIDQYKIYTDSVMKIEQALADYKQKLDDENTAHAIRNNEIKANQEAELYLANQYYQWGVHDYATTLQWIDSANEKATELLNKETAAYNTATTNLANSTVALINSLISVGNAALKEAMRIQADADMYALNSNPKGAWAAYDADNPKPPPDRPTFTAGSINANVTGGKLDSIGDNEDIIKFLREIASVEYINRYVNNRPKIDITFGDVRETADVDHVLRVLEDRVIGMYSSELTMQPT